MRSSRCATSDALLYVTANHLTFDITPDLEGSEDARTDKSSLVHQDRELFMCKSTALAGFKVVAAASYRVDALRCAWNLPDLFP